MTSTHANYMSDEPCWLSWSWIKSLIKYCLVSINMTLTLQIEQKSVSGDLNSLLIGFILGIVIGLMGTPHPVAGVEGADK